MLFSSITFLFYFLPIVIIFHYLSPVRFKNIILLIASLLFYSLGEPVYVILMLISIYMGYLIGINIEKHKGTVKAKRWMVFAVILSMGCLGYYKYADFFIENVNRVTNLSIPLLHIPLPLGISFYLFQILSYTIDVYRGEVSASKKLIPFMAYATLFPQLIAGPIVRYSDVQSMLNKRNHNIPMIYSGIRRFLIGLAKKSILADSFGLLCEKFLESSNPSVLFYWIYAIAYTLQIYYDFSGYSDMAIGLGRIFGFEFMENFNYPYVAKSITEFWRRWHISLSTWFRDYVYIPLGGNRVSKGRQIRNILLVWILTGFWHGAAWNFIIWGLMYAILLILEKNIRMKDRRKIPSILSHIYVLFVTIIGFVIFHSDNLAQVIIDIKGMFALNELPFITKETIYQLQNYLILFIFSIIGATPYIKNLYTKLMKKEIFNKLFVIFEPAFLMFLLFISTGYLIDDSFHPFLYFRF